MSTVRNKETASAVASAEKGVILSMGGKGGVGKTGVIVALAEWFNANEVPAKLLDLYTENKARGSLTHFFGGNIPKANIHTPAGLDAFVDHLSGDGPAVILADMGAGSGQVTHDWFEKMYPDVAEARIVFTAIGVVTSDPASVESVLAWAKRLQHRVRYLIVENSITAHSDFTFWRDSKQALQFQEVVKPAVIHMDYRLADLENGARRYGVTLGDIATRRTDASELQKASLVMRAQSYRRRIFAEFEKVTEVLLP
jgi:MinD-like ATPase involved in chromosome partitioning or flagellar assembly